MIISISDLRINNKPYSGTAIKITDPYPTINWEYDLVDRVSTDGDTITGITTAGPGGYEVRIGTSSTNQGTNAFSGSVIATGAVVSQATSYRYKGHALTRGTTYYGQVRVTDSLGNVSSWSTFRFQYNSVPSASAASITPAVPSVSDVLLLSYTFTDSDGDLESGSKIWWFKNGVHQLHLDGLSTIPSVNLKYGDSWYARVYPSDGNEVGTATQTSTVIVKTTAPVLDTLELLPQSPTVGDPLFAKYNFSGEFSDQSVIKWYINGAQATGFDKRLARLPVSVGDVVYFTVTSSDGISTGATYASASATIADARLVISGLRINHEKEPLSVFSLTPSVSWNVGPAGKTPTLTYVLIGSAPGADNVLNVSLSGDVTSYTVPSGTFERGRDYYVTVFADDSDRQTIHLRTQGSRWKEGVSNSTGWTIETTFRINSGYQGFRIYDGTKHAEIRFYQDKVQIISGQMTEFSADFSEFSTVTITGRGSDINVYRNYNSLGVGHWSSSRSYDGEDDRVRFDQHG
jgi:hypothetical protein